MNNVLIISNDEKFSATMEESIPSILTGLLVVGNANSLSDGLKIIGEERVDVMLLDISICNFSQEDIHRIKKLTESIDLIIFSQEDHALIAFEYGACAYVPKPVHLDKLKMALEKIIHRKGGHTRNFTNVTGTGVDILNKKICLFDKYEFNFPRMADIYYCKAEGFYTRFIIRNSKEIFVSKNIKQYEHILPTQHFFRSHKSYLINLNEIKKYVKGGYVEMENGDKIPLSVRKKEFFLKAIMEYKLKPNA